MLKIYHLHEKIQDYEEDYDKILESHFFKEKLENKIKELEKIIKHTNCDRCPLYFCKEECINNCDKCEKTKAREIEKFCKYYKPFEDEITVCENFSTKKISYYIEEKEIDISKEEILILLNNLK